MKKVLVILLFLFVFLMGIASAEELLYQQNIQIDVKIPCFNNGSLCSSNAECNLTVVYPNSSIMVNNGQMTNSGSYHNLTLPDSSTKGTYPSTMVCCDLGNCGFSTPSIIINATGEEFTIAESILYVLLAIALFVLFLIGLYANIVIPYSNRRNSDNQIIAITKTKYLKMGLILINYAIFIWFLNILIGISNSFVNLPMSYAFIEFLFMLLNYLALPLFVIIFVWALFEILRDLKFQELINKFGSAIERR